VCATGQMATARRVVLALLALLALGAAAGALFPPGAFRQPVPTPAPTVMLSPATIPVPGRTAG
jgi:hypothetical protein